MNRRRLVVMVSGIVLASILIVVGLSLLFVTSTDYGRNRIVRPIGQRLLGAAVHGKVYIGHVTDGFLTSVSVDSFAIRDNHGELFLSTGPVTVSYDPRDLADQRILIHAARIEHPFIHIIQHKGYAWNFQEIFPPSHGPPRPRSSPRQLLDYIVLDSVSVRNATVQLTLPWTPDDTLHGAALDSSIAEALRRRDKIIRRASDGFSRTYVWSEGNGFLSHIRLADPDSDRFGKAMRIDTLNVNEFEPPFAFRHVSGDVRILAESVFFNAPHFDLPASTGSGHGHIWWGHDLPTRYDIAIRGDSVALNDVAWVYPTLPRTGGGSMLLTIRNENNLKYIDFKLSNLDVRSTKSHLTGTMTFGTQAPVLLVRDVDLRGDPVDFDLVRTLAGHAFPVDWQGQIYGTARGPGGPLTHFVLTDAQATWHDTHVAGAISHATGRGELDIVDPAVTAFHHFDVNASRVDLRSIEYLFPSFLRLGGYVSGTATLDSSWLDVRFSDAHIVHQDGAGEPSQFTGAGRVTYGEKYMTYDISANAQPLSLKMLSRSYPKLPFRGLVTGPVQIKGATTDLETTTSLQGPAGALSFQGRLNLDSTLGYGAHGNGQFGNLDLQRLLEKPNIRSGALNGHYEVDLSDISMARTRGVADVALDRGVFDSLAILPSHARVAFADGKMRVDTLLLSTTAFHATAAGAIGMPSSGANDSLFVKVDVDSLGGFRSYIGHPDTSVTGDEIVPDSLAGDMRLTAVARGRLDSLALRGRVTASSLYARKSTINDVTGTFDVDNLWKKPTGFIAFHADTASVGWIKLDTLGVRLQLAGLDSGSFNLGIGTTNGQAAYASGALAFLSGARGARARLDSAAFALNNDAWRLIGPASIRFDSTGAEVDSLTFLNADSALVVAKISAPVTGPAAGIVQAKAVPLADVGVALQLAEPLTGRGDMIATIGGTSAAPVITTTGELRDLHSGSVQVERIGGTGEYRDQRFQGSGDVFLKGRAAVHSTVSLPLAVQLFSMRRLPDSLHVTVHADSADLGILQALGLPVDSTSGRLKGDVDIGGSWVRIVPKGHVTITNGAMTLSRLDDQRITDIQADIEANGRDSLVIKQLSASSQAGPRRNSLSLTGIVTSYLDTTAKIDLTLKAKQFHVDTRGVAKLNISTTYAGKDSAVYLRGTLAADTLSGSINIDAGQVILPDPVVAQKVIQEDTTRAVGNQLATNGLIDDFMKGLVPAQDLTITLSDQVRLQSQDASIPLSGSLNVVKVNNANVPNPSFFTRFGLAPTGVLSANSGRYTLNLGVVQRVFTVQPGGTVGFDGTLPINPQIHLRARYTVRQNGKPDIGVDANVDGQLDPGPKLTFSSDQSYEISQSDLVSYLVAGQPGFLGDNPDVAKTVFQVLAPTLSTLAQQRLTQSITGLPVVGPLVQQYQFQLQFQGGVSGPVGANNTDVTGSQVASSLGSSLTNYLYTSSIGGQVQLTDKLSVGFSSGLCLLKQQTTSLTLPDMFSGRLQYRLGASSDSYSVQAGREASTAARYCGTSVGGVIAAPSQWSLGLSRFWRF